MAGVVTAVSMHKFTGNVRRCGDLSTHFNIVSAMQSWKDWEGSASIVRLARMTKVDFVQSCSLLVGRKEQTGETTQVFAPIASNAICHIMGFEYECGTSVRFDLANRDRSIAMQVFRAFENL